MKWRRVLIIALSMGVVFGLGGTYAAFRGASNPIDQQVTTTNIGVGAKQEVKLPEGGASWVYDEATGEFLGMTPGSVVEMTVGAENTGSTESYMMIHLNASWYQNEEKYFDVGSGETSGVEFTLNEQDWIVIRDGEDVYGYYKYPVAVGDSTTELLQGFSVLANPTENSNKYANLQFKMDYNIESVQTLAGDEAMLAQWGMVATFDANNNITAIVEQ